LTLPQSLIDSLRLPWLCRQQGMLADGSLHTFDVCSGTIEWEGNERTIEIEAAEIEPLLGMSLWKVITSHWKCARVEKSR
jgi:predicted aspartyl protease